MRKYILAGLILALLFIFCSCSPEELEEDDVDINAQIYNECNQYLCNDFTDRMESKCKIIMNKDTEFNVKNLNKAEKTEEFYEILFQLNEEGKKLGITREIEEDDYIVECYFEVKCDNPDMSEFLSGMQFHANLVYHQEDSLIELVYIE